VNVADRPQSRPKSPWTESYSVSVQGSLDPTGAEVRIQRGCATMLPETDPLHQDRLLLSQVGEKSQSEPTGAVEWTSGTADRRADPQAEHITWPALVIEPSADVQISIEEQTLELRPASPWTPSYSVAVQGSHIDFFEIPFVSESPPSQTPPAQTASFPGVEYDDAVGAPDPQDNELEGRRYLAAASPSLAVRPTRIPSIELTEPEASPVYPSRLSLDSFTAASSPPRRSQSMYHPSRSVRTVLSLALHPLGAPPIRSITKAAHALPHWTSQLWKHQYHHDQLQNLFWCCWRPIEILMFL
jgi:hypothetical protein